LANDEGEQEMMTLTTLALMAAGPIERIGEPTLNGRQLPFSEAVRAGDTLYLSGKLAIGPDGKPPAGIEAQTRMTMDSIAATLTKSGSNWGEVVKCTVMLEDMKDWPAFNTVYMTYFKPGQMPARSAFGADGLALGALVEVECIAYSPRKKK
jgi:2-iminobutanoate/2-iminopropanoate deaminase